MEESVLSTADSVTLQSSVVLRIKPAGHESYMRITFCLKPASKEIHGCLSYNAVSRRRLAT
jgi:hypothetical protein